MKYKEIELEVNTEYDFSNYPTSGIWLNTTTGNVYYVNRVSNYCVFLEHREQTDKVFGENLKEQINELPVVLSEEQPNTVSESFALKMLAIATADKRAGINTFDL